MSNVHLVYFSPTGTTRKICEQVALGLGGLSATTIDLTLPGPAPELVLAGGVAVIGVPVYAGRVPALCLERMQAIRAQGVPAVLVAVYGNREFEDALVELQDVCTDKGFTVVAAGAFIGEHSYSTPERPIGAGRPDAEDLNRAVEFGRQVAEKLAAGTLAAPEIAGNRPYKDRVPLGGIAPETDPLKCTLCGRCAAVCPVGIITVTDKVVTDPATCVMCCACIKVCADKARFFHHPRIEERREMLVKNCSTPKAPKVFL